MVNKDRRNNEQEGCDTCKQKVVKDKSLGIQNKRWSGGRRQTDVDRNNRQTETDKQTTASRSLSFRVRVGVRVTVRVRVRLTVSQTITLNSVF
jgi:hypothetical protein